MISGRYKRLSRRDFLKIATIGAGGLALEGCRRRLGVEVTAIPSPPAIPTPQPVPSLPPVGNSPNIILVNGKVVIMDAANTQTQAVAISGGQILQSGSNETIQALADQQTQMIDLRGRTVTPGFVDSHNHLSAMGLIGTAYIDINPPAVKTITDLQVKITEGCARTTPGKWVIAQGYIAFEGHYPDKFDIDPVSPNHPVMLINQGGHMGAVNSYALRLAGVNANSPNPPFGIIIRDDNNEPTGALVNHAAMDIFRRLWSEEVLTQELLEQATIAPQVKFASVGVTSFGDVNARGVPKVKAYFDVARRGEMTIRGYILNTIEYYQELAGRAEEIEAMRAYTMTGAYADFEESVKGSLEPGKMADLVVWKEDPFILSPKDLAQSTIDMTMVGGRVVYEGG